MTYSDQVRIEQDYLDRLYRRLDQLREQTRRRLRDVRIEGPTGSPQNRSERDSFAALHEDRLAQLEAVEDRLCFGKLDLDSSQEQRYIGRLGLADTDHSQLLTDWRAPAAQPFYQATAAHPLGVRRRRHLMTRGRQVRGIEDELLDLGADDDGLPLSGEGALLAALNAHRTGKMTDIVATIQAEQDAIIRSELAGVLVVQGAPGTGKTAVALHRAAYLLYTHRQALASSGVLLIGPSAVFLNYIDQVLPALGETGVVATTIADLLPGVRARGTEPEDVAEIKGRATMAGVVRRAIRQRQRVPAEPQHLQVDQHTVTLYPHDVSRARERARASRRPHNAAREIFVREVLARLADQYAVELGLSAQGADRAELIDDLRTSRQVRVALNLCWLPMSPQRLVEDLYIKPHRLRAAAPELSKRERQLLARPAGSPWTPADVPLLDEAAELLGEDDQAARAQQRIEAEREAREVAYARQVLASSGNSIVPAAVLAGRFAEQRGRRTAAEAAVDDRSWTYGHIVVDEAQELSAMDWRMLLRRCPRRSMTVVGDTGQRHRPGGTADWAQTFNPMVGRRGWRVRELSVNYRTPGQIMDFADRVARAGGLPVTSATAARDVPDSIREVQANPVEFIGPAMVDELAGDVGAIAVIAGAERLEELAGALAAAGVSAGDATARSALGGPVTLLTPVAAKGLEFDVVYLIEPGEIFATPTGANDLYVAASRPTQRLVLVHRMPLPVAVAE